jgi:hypothetical protein
MAGTRLRDSLPPSHSWEYALCGDSLKAGLRASLCGYVVHALACASVGWARRVGVCWGQPEGWTTCESVLVQELVMVWGLSLSVPRASPCRIGRFESYGGLPGGLG